MVSLSLPCEEAAVFLQNVESGERSVLGLLRRYCLLVPFSSLWVGVSPAYKDFFLPSRTSEPAVGLAVSLPLSVLKPHWVCSFYPLSCEHPGFCDFVCLLGDITT